MTGRTLSPSAVEATEDAPLVSAGPEGEPRGARLFFACRSFQTLPDSQLNCIDLFRFSKDIFFTIWIVFYIFTQFGVTLLQ